MSTKVLTHTRFGGLSDLQHRTHVEGCEDCEEYLRTHESYSACVCCGLGFKHGEFNHRDEANGRGICDRCYRIKCQEDPEMAAKILAVAS